ncbi:hypothetical protein [Brachybacterium hainanense]|uniref:Uncharacterized protein n=1 Tax=Brachybacterium hainanense TaxID=1541174 RepID=A0ABV6R943_9MICO
MTTYLYRPVATETVEIFDTSIGEVTVIEPGDNLGGRRGGYLSRSSAVAHGKDSGVPFRIERSAPVTFGTQRPTAGHRAAERRARLGDALADLVLAGNTSAALAVAREISARS